MGNITGKGDGEEAGHDAQADSGSVASNPATVASVSASTSATSTSPAYVTTAALSTKRRTNDVDTSLHDDDPYAVLERVFGDKGIPMVFRWESEGDEVFITGTFNHWSAKIPMARSGNDFVHIQELSRGKHAFKFIVDDEWRFAPDQHTMADKSGNINNFLDLTDFKPKFENLPDLSISIASKYLDESLYGNRIPDINEYTREPQSLPPHLRSIVLNYKSGIPQHVTLDHLYCTARTNGLMVLGMSQRYQHKYVTTIYYSPVTGGFPGVIPNSKRSSSLGPGAPGSASKEGSASSASVPKSVPSSGSVKRPFGQ